MKNKKALFNPLILLIFLLIMIVNIIFLVIASNSLNQIEDKACAKLGYDKYYDVGGKVGICEKDNGNFINVKMICENDKTYEILLGKAKCKAVKIKEDE